MKFKLKTFYISRISIVLYIQVATHAIKIKSALYCKLYGAESASTIQTGVEIDVNHKSYPAGLQRFYTNAAMRNTALFVGLSENPIF